MRDISHKIKTLRTAKAQAIVKVKPETIQMLRDNQVPKGDPIPFAKVAAIQAAKNTPQMIPYCHPLPIDFVGVDIQLLFEFIQVQVTVKTVYKTGVEVEAMTAATIGALTLYDMLKPVDDAIEIQSVKLLEKTGGKSDFAQTSTGPKLQAAVLVMSDTIASGKKKDTSGQSIMERLKQQNIAIHDYRVITDDPDRIEFVLKNYIDTGLDLVITSGGTGLSPRDNTPEVMAKLIEREVPGISEAIRAYGQDRTPYAMLSRSVAGMAGRTLIINLPGSRRGVEESLDAIFPAILHSFKMMAKEGHPDDQAQSRE